jgi:hypothetical protein
LLRKHHIATGSQIIPSAWQRREYALRSDLRQYFLDKNLKSRLVGLHLMLGWK